MIPATLENHTYGVDQEIPLNLMSIIGHNIGVGKKSAV
tara:strand:- start:52 stop:165 length:114 start_codon:yes stop_codon:yes gene_type:complete